MKTTKLILLFAVFCIAAAACKKEELQIDKDKKVISDYLKEHNIEAQQTEKLFYVENVVGTGQQCKLGDTVAIKYRYSSLKDPSKILEDKTDIAEIVFLPLSTSSYSTCIMGFQIGLPTMKEGGKTTFYFPSAYAFGRDTLSNGENYANLIFDVELCEIITRDKRH
ncbi:MAG: FKBP-type peptidyl-prolyl cis-trans isomerase [Bacteroidales bacterium]|nr:FKBP-type peptidyl-prolyl cis-trans isomerase [Bacteroidales bacterium]